MIPVDIEMNNEQYAAANYRFNWCTSQGTDARIIGYLMLSPEIRLAPEHEQGQLHQMLSTLHFPVMHQELNGNITSP